MYVYLCMYVCTYLYHSRYYNLDPSALRSVQHTHQQYPSICSHIVHGALSNIHTSSIPIYAHLLFTALCPTYTPAVSHYMLTYFSLRSVQHTHQQYPSICSHTRIVQQSDFPAVVTLRERSSLRLLIWCVEVGKEIAETA